MTLRRTLLLGAAAAGATMLILACGRKAPPTILVTAPGAPFVHAEGEALAARLQCFSCHDASAAVLERVSPLSAPRLATAGGRLNPNWIRHWLDNPHAEGAASRMPDLFHGLPSAERGEAIEDLTHFLAAQGGPFTPAATRPDNWQVDEGQRIFNRLGCFACHTAGELEARNLASKSDHAQLAAFLLDPLIQRPGGGMPDFSLSETEASALASWLLREQFAAGPIAEDLVPGVSYEYVELPEGAANLRNLSAMAELPATRAGLAAAIGLLPDHREDFFSYRFEGWLQLDAPATLRFGLNSDDGSDLRVDGNMVVANDGEHAPQEKSAEVALASGRHRIQVRMFEAAGGETLEAWVERNGRREALGAANLSVIGSVYAPAGYAPWASAPERVERGRQRFASLGCANCHDDLGAAPVRAAPFASLKPEAGCLADAPTPRAAHYLLDAGQKAALRAVVAQARELERPLAAAAKVTHTLLRLDCVACHARAGAGGPAAAVRALFTGDGDVGDEGRIPPDLTGVGGKLRPDWLAEVLAGSGAVRFYVHARMPRFSPDHVRDLPAAFAAADPAVGENQPVVFSAEAVEAGRALAGAGGLNCIQCHVVAGHAAQGMQTMDLTTMQRRLQPAWFRKWLLNPIAMRSGTRMPVFYSGGRAVSSTLLDGDADRQIRALWSWLSLGESMPLPPGLIVADDAYELVPVDRPIYVGALMQNGSSRMVNVGFPERVHLTFDFEHARLMQVWRGDFFNAEGTWNGRAGQVQVPKGESIRPMPPGPSFARLADPGAEWPLLAGRDGAWRMNGQRRDAQGRPTFRYHHGSCEIEESLLPQYAEGGPALIRRFRVTLPTGEEGWYLRADLDGALKLTFKEPWHPITRTSASGAVETLLPLPRGDGSTLEIEVNLQW